MEWWSDGGVASFCYQIVGGPHFSVGAGGADLHFGSGELVEEEGCAPVVHEFAAAINAQA